MRSSKQAKRRANKAVRRYVKKYLDRAPRRGRWHRKVTPSYDIYDWRDYSPKEEWEKDEIDIWAKYYFRK